MSDIVKRLREYRPTNEWGEGVSHSICDEAADRIQAATDALHWYADQMCEGWCDKDPKACEHIGAENCAGCPARIAIAKVMTTTQIAERRKGEG